MNVRELIDALSGADPDATVVVGHWSGGGMVHRLLEDTALPLSGAHAAGRYRQERTPAVILTALEEADVDYDGPTAVAKAAVGVSPLFQPGDRVRIIGTADQRIWGTYGTVQGLSGNGRAAEVAQHVDGEVRWYGVTALEHAESGEFQVGDRVRILAVATDMDDDDDCRALVGSTGTVVETDYADTDGMHVMVEADAGTWWYDHNSLEHLAEEEPADTGPTVSTFPTVEQRVAALEATVRWLAEEGP